DAGGQFGDGHDVVAAAGEDGQVEDLAGGVGADDLFVALDDDLVAGLVDLDLVGELGAGDDEVAGGGEVGQDAGGGQLAGLEGFEAEAGVTARADELFHLLAGEGLRDGEVVDADAGHGSLLSSLR